MPTKVELRGNVDLRKAMRSFTPDLEKNLRKDLRDALKPVVNKAKGFAPSQSPLSGWSSSSFSEGNFPKYNRTTVANGITYSTSAGRQTRKGFTSQAAIMNQSAGGAIFETAGRKNPNGQRWVGPKVGGRSKGVSRSSNPKAGATFIANLPPLVKTPEGEGRLIYRAWSASQGVAKGAALSAIDKTKQEFYARSATTTFTKGK